MSVLKGLYIEMIQ